MVMMIRLCLQPYGILSSFLIPGYFHILSLITYIAKEDSRLEIKNSHSVLAVVFMICIKASDTASHTVASGWTYMLADFASDNNNSSLNSERSSNLRLLLPLLTLCQLHILLPIHHLQRLGLV